MASVLGLAGVWLTLRQNIWCFPAGIVSVGIYSYIFFISRLYADSALQVVYVVLLMYGWYRWSRGLQDRPLPVTKLSGAERWLAAATIAALTGIFYFVLKRFTDSDVPFADAITTGMSLVAQYLVAQKKIENWIIWIVADIIYVWLFIYKDLNFTSVLYFIFIILAIKGFIEWKRNLRKAL